ncbi:MAG: 7-cyano-7-deazaguanine synthase QueC [Deltaproteobacteria bacterium]|nr:7-cyano-7-deazaguanine synthase QueC [Deltaproteobacteria bacterium]
MRESAEAPPAVVLLSGGLDSTTVLAEAQHQGYVCHALTVQYGQRHQAELAAARRVAQAYGVARHLVLDLDLRAVGGSALTADLEVPKDRDPREMEQGVPVTYVPARNTVFLSLALAWAEALDATDLFIGVNALDYSGYPDCRPEFILAFENLANLATRLGTEQGRRFRVHTPLIRLTKAEIIKRGLELGVDYALTHSCYDPAADERPCGRCDSCLLREKGFREAGLVDPVLAAPR